MHNRQTTTVKTVGHKRKTIKVKTLRCTTKTVTGPVKFKIASVDRAALSRGRILYATGSAMRTGKRPELLLSPFRPLESGRYTLTLTWTDTHRHRHSTHEIIAMR